jgi:fumarate reductase subunit C
MSERAPAPSATSASYTPYHPRWLRRRVSTYWWLKRGSYLAFILRELSSVFIAWFVAFLLLFIRAVSQGPAAYEAFLDWARGPLVVFLNLITLAFVTFHAVTWFNLAPRAMVVDLGGRRLPGALIAGSNYAAWIAVSALLFWILVG